jgi:hypothetical protein
MINGDIMLLPLLPPFFCASLFSSAPARQKRRTITRNAAAEMRWEILLSKRRRRRRRMPISGGGFCYCYSSIKMMKKKISKNMMMMIMIMII